MTTGAGGETFGNFGGGMAVCGGEVGKLFRSAGWEEGGKLRRSESKKRNAGLNSFKLKLLNQIVSRQKRGFASARAAR